jgi:predicted nucleic acid-binding protein
VILVDTSVWVDHLYDGDPKMFALLEAKQVLAHEFVVGELAMGQLTDREAVMLSFESLSFAEAATHEEVLSRVERHRISGTGIGYIDAHILASAMLTTGCRLWTRDKRLRAQAEKLGLAAPDLE